MSCDYGQEPTSSFLDRETAGADVRHALQGLGWPAAPEELTARLRVIASHERQRRLARSSVSAFARHCFAQVQLAFDNMMKPFALPFAGGALSAVALFGMLVPTLSFPHNFADGSLFTYPDGTVVIMGSSGAYVPDPPVDMPRIVPADYADPDDANVVELTIDEKGRVSDYSVARGHLTPDLQSIIMFSEFTPATLMGTPTSAKVKIVQSLPVRRQMRNVRS